jgi:hypothetical protein
VSVTVCELFPALSVIVSVPVLVQLAVGSKKTPMAQVEPAATVLPQAFSMPKSVALVVTPVMSRGVLPLFTTVTLCGRPEVPTYWAGNVILDGVTVTCGAVAPVPVRGTVSEAPPETTLIAMFRLPVRLPNAPGVKVTLMEQRAATGTLPTQLFVSEKSEAFVPLTAIAVMVSAVD